MNIMIERYEIKKENNQDVLYLYLNYQYEFAFLEKENLKNMIKKYNIPFTSGIIVLVVSGIIVKNIYLKPISSKEKKEEKINIIEIINDNKKIDSTIPIEEKEKETQKEEKEKNKIEQTDTEKNTISSEEKITYISIRKNQNIISLPIEEYVIGVVAAEMPASFEIEALKAQAILARTYAKKALEKNQIIEANNSTQNYKSSEELQKEWKEKYDFYYNKIKLAVEETKNLYLTYDGYYIEAVYHSTSNGKTENSEAVWKNYYPYLVSVDSPYDNNNPSFEKEIIISYEELSQKLQDNINIDTKINVLERNESNRISSIQIGEKIYSGIQLRNILNLRSTDFELSKKEEGVIFHTKGYGHGVGMSQYGANGFAKAGYTYQEILSHYYPNTTLTKT